MGTRATGTITPKQRRLTPTADWVVFRQAKEEFTTPAGLVLPENAGGAEEGDVVAIGPGVTSVLVGDRIKFVGAAISFDCDGETYFMARDAQPVAADIRNDPQGNPVGPPFVCVVLRRTEQYQ